MLKLLNIRNQTDFAAGLLYIVVGGAFAIGASNYTMGSAARMGPAYFPFWLGLILAIVGVVVLLNSLRLHTSEVKLPKFHWGLLAWILLSVALFGLLLPRLGLLLSLVALVIVSSRASHEFGWKGTLLNVIFLLAVCVGAFVYGLGLQLPLWPTFME